LEKVLFVNEKLSIWTYNLFFFLEIATYVCGSLIVLIVTFYVMKILKMTNTTTTNSTTVNINLPPP
jgi:hypothetical protein